MGGRRAFGATVVVLAITATSSALAGAPTIRESVATVSDCTDRTGALSYLCPAKPFDQPHPVRGNFGDPRTVFEPGGGGHFSFHNGVDIAAPDGTPVYPVLSGTVAEVRSDEVVVATPIWRRFQYYHLLPIVQLGEEVVQGRTVLGYVKRPFHHVHLSEIDQGIVQNPLAPGHLTPYADTLPPVVSAVSFVGATGKPLRADAPTNET